MMIKKQVLKFLLYSTIISITDLIIISAVQGVTLTNQKFTDTRQFFNWEFTWDGKGGNNVENFLPDRTLKNEENNNQDDGKEQWKVSVSLTTDQFSQPAFLILNGQHITKVHQLDAPQGGQLTKNLEIGNLNLTPGTNFREAFKETVIHLHNPDPDHENSYSLLYKANQDNTVNFQFNGVHTGTGISIPESSMNFSLLVFTIIAVGSIFKEQIR